MLETLASVHELLTIVLSYIDYPDFKNTVIVSRVFYDILDRFVEQFQFARIMKFKHWEEYFSNPKHHCIYLPSVAYIEKHVFYYTNLYSQVRKTQLSSNFSPLEFNNRKSITNLNVFLRSIPSDDFILQKDRQSFRFILQICTWSLEVATKWCKLLFIQEDLRILEKEIVPVLISKDETYSKALEIESKLESYPYLQATLLNGIKLVNYLIPLIKQGVFTRNAIIMKYIVFEDPTLIVYTAQELRAEKSWVLDILYQAPSIVFPTLPKPIRNDPIIIKRALQIDPSVYLMLSRTQSHDRGIIEAAIDVEPEILYYVQDVDKELCLRAVRKNGKSLYACKNFYGDKAVVLEAVRNCGMAITCADEELQEDREVVFEALKQDPRTISHISKHWQYDKVLLSEVAKYNKELLHYVSFSEEELKYINSKKRKLFFG